MMVRALAALVAVPWLIDVVVRLVLARVCRRRSPDRGVPTNHRRWTVVIPSRDEGSAVRPTLESVGRAANSLPLNTILLLDGDDKTARDAAVGTGAGVIVKEPEGPTKGEALRWMVANHRAVLDESDAVLILDVGSRLREGFFETLIWPEGARAVQARLVGTGSGVGGAAAFSESAAQAWEDAGRQELGWTVHLRGTGSALDREIFCSVVPRLRTRAEDTEMTLLLASEGHRVALGGSGAHVEDMKPCAVDEAARQRARWLLGELGIMLRHPRALLQLLRRRPAEGLAFACELVSRPLSLTALIRAVLAMCLALDAALSETTFSAVVAGVLVASLAIDAWLLRLARGATRPPLTSSATQLCLAWMRALVLLPKTLLGWARTRNSRTSGSGKTR